MNQRSIVYVQYTDPAAYPPLEHSAQLLARAGWQVLFIGIDAFGVGGFELRAHENIRVERVGGASGGLFGTLKYASFATRAAALARAFRPSWIYASDPLSAPAARLMKAVTGARVLYHEHDVPAPSSGARQALALRARDRLMRDAALLVVPGAERRHSLGVQGDRAQVVWNCPLVDEIAAEKRAGKSVTLVYAGSITPDRLPVTFIQALAKLPHEVRLDVFGYTTVGRPEYVEELMRAARNLGVHARVKYRGALPRREQLLAGLSEADIGIATVNAASADDNLRAMVGPSNKPFDYMARGLPFLVTDDAAWRETFVDPGYAVACAPSDAASIRAAVTTLLDADKRAEIGRRARDQIATKWNYERQFAPVLEALQG